MLSELPNSCTQTSYQLRMSFLWVYGDSADKWHVLSAMDQAAVETAHATKSNSVVPVKGGRCDASVHTRTMKAAYSERSETIPLVRASWFANGVPYSEEDSEKISIFVASTMAASTPLKLADKQISKDSAGNLVESASISILAGTPLTRVENGDIKDTKVLKDIDEDGSRPYTHLILCIHGVGESMWSKKAFNLMPFDEGCSTFRQLLCEFAQGTDSRIEVLPIEWFHIFSQSDCAKRIADVTLPTVPLIRQFANGTVSDVIFYLDPIQRHKVLRHVAKRIVDIWATFRTRNPAYAGKLSLIGHSLGSVIAYDLLSSDIVSPDIIFDNLYLFGSPLSMFLTARNSPEVTSLKLGGSFYNIFQPHDPVAYRIEPFMNPLLKNVEPAWIPSYLTGGISAQTKLRQATSSLWSIFAKGDAEDSKVSIAVRLQQVMSGNGGMPNDSRATKAVDDLIKANNTERIDWSVQVGFTPTEYANAVSAHVSYFSDRDVAKFIFTKSA